MTSFLATNFSCKEIRPKNQKQTNTLCQRTEITQKSQFNYRVEDKTKNKFCLKKRNSFPKAFLDLLSKEFVSTCENFDNLINCYDLTDEKIISAKASFNFCELSELPRPSEPLSLEKYHYCYNHEKLSSCLTNIPSSIISSKDKEDLKNLIKSLKGYRKSEDFDFWKNLLLDLLGKQNPKIDRCVINNRCQTYVEHYDYFDYLKRKVRKGL